MILLILSFLVGVVFGDDNPCDFVSGQLYDDPSKVVSCLKTLPFDENCTEITGLIPLIKDYLESFVFLDLLKKPPSSYESLKIDLFAELDGINNHIFDTYDNAYDFYWAVASIFLKLKDAHTFFYMPCAASFYWTLPYFFSASLVDGNITITAEELSVANVTAHYINDNSGVNITGKIITKIDLNGDGYEDAWVAIAKFADDYEYLSKDPNARLNRVLLNDFFNRRANQLPYPGSNITIQYLDDNNNPTDLVLPFYARSTASVNITNIDDVCPLLNSTNSTATTDNNNNNTNTQTQTKPKIKTTVGSSPKLLLRRLQREEHRRTLQLLETVESSVHTAPSYFSSHSPSPFPPSFPSSSSFPSPLPASSPPLSPSLSPSSSSTGVGGGGGGGGVGDNIGIGDDPTFATIANSSFLIAGVVADKSIGYIRILDFVGDSSLDNPTLDWALQVGNALKALKTDPFVQYLLVDVRGNGGGFVNLGMQLNKFLFPSIFPVYGIYDIVQSKVNLEISKIPDDPDDLELHRNTTFDILTDWYNESVAHNFTELNGTAYTRNFTQTWMLDLGDQDNFDAVVAGWPEKGTSSLFDPQHILFATDGLCGSTCACFLKHVQEEQLGRIVGLGGYPGHDSPAAFDSASFSGGTVFSSDSVYGIKTSPAFQQYINPANLPNPFPRNTTLLRWAQHEIYSYTTAPDVLEFKLNPVDFVEPIYPGQHSTWPEDVLALINTLMPYYNVCAPHEVQASPDDCSNDTDINDTNAIYGHPCLAYANGTYGWDTNTCVYARCTDGFFRNHTSGTCDAVPVLYYPPHPHPGEPKKKNKLVAIFIIVGIAAAVVIVLVIIVTVAVCLHRSKKAKKKEKATATDSSYAKM